MGFLTYQDGPSRSAVRSNPDADRSDGFNKAQERAVQRRKYARRSCEKALMNLLGALDYDDHEKSRLVCLEMRRGRDALPPETDGEVRE